MGYFIIDSVLLLPGWFDLFYSGAYGKYKGTDFNVNMISTSIPRPDAEANAYARQQAAQAQAMADAANAMSNGINQAAQQIQNSKQYQPPPPAPRPTPAAPAQTVAPKPVTPAPKPNFKRWCPKHGEWDGRFSAGCPACRATINW